MSESKLSSGTIYFILLYFLVFGSLYVFLTPPFESPDEYLHLDYINYISKYKELPNQYEGYNNPSIFVGQGHQHPLYYILFSVPVHLFSSSGIIEYDHPSSKDKNWIGGTPGKSTETDIFVSEEDKVLFYAIRFFSLLFSLVTLHFIFRISKLFFKEQTIQLLTVFIAASIPQFQFISAVINNDSISNMFAAAGIFYLLKMMDSPRDIKQYIYAALCISLGILAKKTVMFILPCAAVITLYLIFKTKGKEAKSAVYKNTFVLFILTLLITSFIFIRNYSEYGEFLGGNMERYTMPQFVEIKSIFSYYFVQPFTTGLSHSFIGVFGWMNVPVPRYIEIPYLLFFVSGFLVSFYTICKKKDTRIIFLFLLFAVCLGGIMYFNLTFTQYQGRYMFPALSAISILSVYGTNALFQKIKSISLKKLIIIILVTILFIFDIISVLTLYFHYFS